MPKQSTAPGSWFLARGMQVSSRIIITIAFTLAATPATADPAAAWAALRRGGHVALLRHADAPGGAGDPPGFKLDDCSTQRNSQ